MGEFPLSRWRVCKGKPPNPRFLCKSEKNDELINFGATKDHLTRRYHWVRSLQLRRSSLRGKLAFGEVSEKNSAICSCLQVSTESNFIMFENSSNWTSTFVIWASRLGILLRKALLVHWTLNGCTLAEHDVAAFSSEKTKNFMVSLANYII